jgi:hypothetical protein
MHWNCINPVGPVGPVNLSTFPGDVAQAQTALQQNCRDRSFNVYRTRKDRTATNKKQHGIQLLWKKIIKNLFRQSALNLHKTTFSQKQHAAMLEDEIDKTVTMLYRSRSRGEFDLGAEDCSLPSLCQDLWTSCINSVMAMECRQYTLM